MTQLQLGSIVIEITRKDIKNVHLSVHPPAGNVTIAAPQRMKLDTIRLFAISKLSWIKQRQRRFAAQVREEPREYIEREAHYVWGKRYLLHVVEHNAPPTVELKHRTLILRVRASTSIERRSEIVENWYREQIRAALPEILDKWQPLLRVSANRTFVQRMKTKWGSANPNRRNIRLNTELAKKPRDCLEYVVLHELSHFLSQRHDRRFVSLLDTHLPHWRALRQKLNDAPVHYDD